MAKNKVVITAILLILVSFFLTACFKTNKKPIAVATASPTVGQAPLEVSFDASDSFDPDGNIISYEWSFGDGSTGSGLTIIHTYNSEGTYQTKLTITDDKGGKDSATVEISIAKIVPYDDLMRHNKDYVGDIIYFRGKEFTDVESAKQSGRQNFNKMLEYIKSHPEIEGILCHKVDRLCRNFKDFVTVDELDVKPLFVAQDFPENATGKLSFGMHVLLAKYYIDNLREEAMKGMRQKAKQGTYPSKAPIGYKNTTDGDGKKIIGLDPSRAQIIRKMFEWYATGNYSIEAVKEKAIREGLRTRHGNKPATSTIEYILKNNFYTSLFEWEGQIYDGDHTPIITTELFKEAQAAFQKDNKPKQRNNRNFTYTGLITCAHCGYSITAERKKGKYTYYHCTDPTGECPKPYIREQDLEKRLGTIVTRIEMNPDKLTWLKTVMKESHQKESKYHEAQVRALERNRRDIKKKIDQAYEDKVEGIIPEKFWLEKSQQWMKERRKIDEAIRHHTEADENYIKKAVETLELLQRIPKLWKKAKPAKKEDC